MTLLNKMLFTAWLCTVWSLLFNIRLLLLFVFLPIFNLTGAWNTTGDIARAMTSFDRHCRQLLTTTGARASSTSSSSGRLSWDTSLTGWTCCLFLFLVAWPKEKWHALKLQLTFMVSKWWLTWKIISQYKDNVIILILQKICSITFIKELSVYSWISTKHGFWLYPHDMVLSKLEAYGRRWKSAEEAK